MDINHSNADLKILDSQLKYQAIVNNSIHAFFLTKPDGRILEANQAACDLFGYTVEEFRNMGRQGIIEYDPSLEIALQQRQQFGRGIGELTAIKKNGERIIIEFASMIFKDISGEDFTSTMVMDISQRRKIEKLLEDTNRLAKVGGWELDLQNNQLYWSPVTKQIHETDQDYVPDLTTAIQFYKEGENRNRILHTVQKGIQSGDPWELDLQIITARGNERWIRTSGRPEFKNGKVIRLYGSFQDIHENKLAEIALRKSEEQFRYIFHNNPTGITIWYLDDLKIAEVNDSLASLYHYSKFELMQMTVLELRPPSDHPLILDFAQKALEPGFTKVTKIWRHCNKEGEELFMEITSNKIEYNGRPAILAVQIDITEKLRLEKKLENEKIEKDKAITSAVINAQEREREELGRELHDNINQLLASSKMYIGMVNPEKEEDRIHLREADEIINNAIEEIRILSHSLTPPSLKEIPFLDAVDKIVKTIMGGSSIQVEKEISFSNENEICDKLRLTIYRIIQEQFSNILKHAQADKIHLKLLQQENKIMLSIKDNGKGTDTTIKTNGIGLMNIKTRASLFNGKVTIRSAPGEGFELIAYFHCQ